MSRRYMSQGPKRYPNQLVRSSAALESTNRAAGEAQISTAWMLTPTISGVLSTAEQRGCGLACFQTMRQPVRSSEFSFSWSILQLNEAETRAVDSTAAAIQVWRTWRPDVLASDIGMPDEDGYALRDPGRCTNGVRATGGSIANPFRRLSSARRQTCRTERVGCGCGESYESEGRGPFLVRLPTLDPPAPSDHADCFDYPLVAHSAFNDVDPLL